MEKGMFQRKKTYAAILSSSFLISLTERWRKTPIAPGGGRNYVLRDIFWNSRKATNKHDSDSSCKQPRHIASAAFEFSGICLANLRQTCNFTRWRWWWNGCSMIYTSVHTCRFKIRQWSSLNLWHVTPKVKGARIVFENFLIKVCPRQVKSTPVL